MVAEVTDEALLDRAGRGDDVAFLVIYERYRDSVYRFIRRLCGSAELAEDVTHDCFLSFIGAPARYEPRRASLRTYLCAAARNLAISRLRREGRYSPLEEAADSGGNGESHGPLEIVLATERQQAVAAAVAALPFLQREAVILFEYEGLSLAEIAAVTDTDMGTIKSRLHRAREGLRRRLARYLTPEAVGVPKGP